jgi:hypothetical protein
MSTLFNFIDEFGTYSKLIQNPSNLLPHFFDLGTIYIAAIVTLITSFGWGQVFCKLSGLTSKNYFSSIDIWLGVLFISISIELINFFIPISWIVSICFILIGIIAIVFNPKPLLGFKRFYSHTWFLTILPIILLMVFFLGSKALYTPWIGDNYLYHYNTIRWLNEFPTIPGLGNLFGALAFNQSYFSFLAPINFYPYFNHAPAIGNLFFITLAFITIIEILFTKIKFKVVIFICFFIAIAKHSDTLHSSNSNFIIALLQVVIFSQLVILFNSKTAQSELDQVYSIFYLCLLIFLYKFSSAAFAGVIVFILAIRFRKLLFHYQKITFKVLGICTLLLCIHLIRGYFISGAPLYPSSLFFISNLPWSVDPEQIRMEALWVMSWARMPEVSPEVVLTNWDWITPWWLSLPTNFIATVVTSIFFFIAALIYPTSKVELKQNLPLYFPLLASLIFWFFTAPAIGFVGSIPELIATLSIWIFFLACPLTQIFLARNITKPIYILITAILCLFAIRSVGIKKISLEGWMSIIERPLTTKETKSGLKVYTPIHGDQCGDSPIPCTPYLNPNLHLLGHDITSGLGR